MSKSHQPTPRRERAARNAGAVPRSLALVDIGSLAALLALASVFASDATHALTALAQQSVRAAFTTPTPGVGLEQAVRTGAPLLGAVLLTVVITRLGIARLQGRFGFPSRTRPSRRPVAEWAFTTGLVLSGVAVMLVGTAGLLASQIHNASQLARTTANGITTGAAAILLELFWKLLALQLLLTLVEFTWRRYAHRRSLRMSQDEVRRERRQSELPPEIRAALRRRTPSDGERRGNDDPR